MRRTVSEEESTQHRSLSRVIRYGEKTASSKENLLRAVFSRSPASPPREKCLKREMKIMTTSKQQARRAWERGERVEWKVHTRLAEILQCSIYSHEVQTLEYFVLSGEQKKIRRRESHDSRRGGAQEKAVEYFCIYFHTKWRRLVEDWKFKFLARSQPLESWAIQGTFFFIRFFFSHFRLGKS